MSDFSVTPQSLHSAASSLRTESAHIHSALKGLEQEVARLRGGWDGSAQQAYDQAQISWGQTFDGMKQLLSRIANATDAMAEDYVAADKKSASYFTKH